MLVGRERAPRFGSDVLRFGTAVLLVLALNVVQVFIVPRRLSVAAFGEYRVFLLYIGYLGVLHLGLIDGAFLRSEPTVSTTSAIQIKPKPIHRPSGIGSWATRTPHAICSAGFK